jgi:serine/threonine protein phosphatase PrpC
LRGFEATGTYAEHMHSFAYTVPLCQVKDSEPESNQDAYLATGNIVGVFDGLAGYPGGNYASQFVAKAVQDYFTTHALTAGASTRALEYARNELLEYRKGQPRFLQQMTSTAVLSCVDDEGNGEVSWCGDSRAYLMKNDILGRVTEDHDFFYASSKLPPMTAAGLRTVLANSLTRSDAWRKGGGLVKKAWTKSHIMHSDIADGPIDTVTFRLEEDELLVLTTDGVHDNLITDQMREAAYAAQRTPEGIAKALVGKAIEVANDPESKRGHADDITCVVLAR